MPKPSTTNGVPNLLSCGLRWKKSEIQKLGTASDRAIAKRLGRSLPAVRTRRQQLGIPAHSKSQTRRGNWTEKAVSLMGKLPDEAIGALVGCTRARIQQLRKQRQIPASQECFLPPDKTLRIEARLAEGLETKAEIARSEGVTRQTIYNIIRRLNEKKSLASVVV